MTNFVNKSLGDLKTYAKENDLKLEITYDYDDDIEKDYEWYSEDFIGCGLEEPTDIKIEDVLGLCEERISKIIGVRI